MKRAAIVGSGMAVPSEVLDNNFFVENGPYRIYEGEDKNGNPIWKKDEWEKEIWLPLTPGGIFELSGIKERRKMSENQTIVDLAFGASEMALFDADLSAKKIEAIVCASVTMPRDFPSLACHLQEKLGAINVKYAVDVAAGCAGSVHVLSLANYLICHECYKNVLVVGAEGLTPRVDYTDRNCFLFGDGAGALILSPSKSGEGIIATDFLSNSCKGETRWLFADKKGFVRMPLGRRVMRLGIRNMVKVSSNVKEKAAKILKIDLKEMGDRIKYYFPHQANSRILDGVAEGLGVKNVYRNIERYGNMSSATWIIALHEAGKRDEVRNGDYVGITAFGSGLASGAAVVKL